MIRLVVILTVCSSALAFSATHARAASFTSQVSGNWSDPVTWGGSGVPGTSDSVAIAEGTSVSVDGNWNCSSLSVANNATLSIDYNGSFNPDTLSVSGNVLNEGSLKLRGLLILASATPSLLQNSGAGHIFGTGLVRTEGNVLLETDNPFDAVLDVYSGTTTVANSTGVTTLAGPVAVDPGAVLKIGDGNSVIARFQLYVQGTLDGSAVGTNLSINSTFPASPASSALLSNDGLVTGLQTLEFEGSNPTRLSGSGKFSSIQTITVSSGATLTLENSQEFGSLVINGILDQETQSSLTAGPISVGSGGLLRNLGTGRMILSGDLANEGTVQLNGGGPACGDVVKILIRSSVAGTERSWSGGGAFSLTDVDVSDQAGSASVTVYGGVKSGKNGPNWIFLNCPNSSSNQIDQPDFFIRQHYIDFLDREPDQGGWDYWTGQIIQCGSSSACMDIQRIAVSDAFFFELEDQQTGAYVYRVYRAAYGNNQPFPNPDTSNLIEAKKIPTYAVFAPDRAQVVGGSDLATSQLAFANTFVQRTAFLNVYPASLGGPDFINAVLNTIKNDIGVDLSSQTPALISLYTQAGSQTAGRAAVMYRLADDNPANPINNRPFIDAEYDRAFVATEYFGYLRRDSDVGGFLFWLGQVNSGPLRDATKQHAMVCSFITSSEYQQRFGSVVTHSNAGCSQ